MRRFRTLLFGLLALVVALAAAVPASGSGPGQVTDEHVAESVILKFAEGTPAAVRDALLSRHGLRVKGQIYGTDTLVLEGKGRAVSALIKALSAEQTVAYVEPDQVVHALGTPNDPMYPNQWNLHKIQAANAFDYTMGSSSVIIAIVDTGVELTHEDLAAKIRTDIDWDFVSNDATAQDDNGHGTHMAGIAAAVTNNAKGIAGVCPNCSILPVRVLNASGSGTLSALASGIQYAADKGAKVINLSVGGSSGSTTLSNAVNYAYSKGAILSCAAGSSGTTSPNYPAYYSNCIAVGATDQNDNITSFSSYGSWLDTCAPGVNILSTYRGNTYTSISGSSTSTAHVSGAAGLYFSKGYTQSQVRTRLTSPTYNDPANCPAPNIRLNLFKGVSLP